MKSTPRLKVYRQYCGSEIIGFARSRTDFIRRTGAERGYVAETSNPAHRALAEEAGPDRYAYRWIGKGEWEIRTSKLGLTQQAIAAARAMIPSGGNGVSFAIELEEARPGGSPSRYVVIDGERRGRWWWTGSRYLLEDMTEYEIKLRREWWEMDGKLSYHERDQPERLWLRSWNEPAALANSIEAWENGLLPPMTEQQARQREREAERIAGRVRQAMVALAGERLEDILGILGRLASGSPVTAAEAAALRNHIQQGAVAAHSEDDD